MIIHLLSQNIRGLNDPQAIDNIRLYIQSNPVDFLFLQEHKLRGQAAENMGRLIWKRATTLYTQALPGYNLNGSSSGKGGVVSLIASKWASLISSTGTILGGRALWFIMSRLPGGDLGFLNIYAPVDTPSHKILWESISRELPNNCRWILLGDFNMVEKRSDKSSSRGNSISGVERRLFNSMKDALGVCEEPLTLPSLSFS